MHVYYITHRPPPVPGAPAPHSTVVAPEALSSETLRATVLAAEPSGVGTAYERGDYSTQQYHLAYPPVSPVPATALDEVARRYADCERCHLSDRRTRIVHVRGNLDAPMAALGEGPGKDEDSRGLPFVGRSGKLQDELFREAGIDPEHDLSWLNLVGCRPCDSRHHPDRVPSLVERAACSERTLMLLRGLRPRILLCLGEQATSMLWAEPPPPNTWHVLSPPDDPRDYVYVAVLRHPAYLLRTIGMANTYKEYAAARLFYRGLRGMLSQRQEKVAVWRLGLRYLGDVGGPIAGGG